MLAHLFVCFACFLIHGPHQCPYMAAFFCLSLASGGICNQGYRPLLSIAGMLGGICNRGYDPAWAWQMRNHALSATLRWGFSLEVNG